jgi:purine-nucleoside phosphorylase
MLTSPQQYFERMKIKGKYPTFAPPKTLIMTVDQEFFTDVLEKYQTQQCDGCFSDVYFLTNYPLVAIAKIGMTSSLAVMNFELTIAWGIKQAIFIGSVCALQKDFALGDLMVCEKAIRDEGTSHHYLPFGKYAYPSVRLQGKLLSVLKELHKPYRLGTIWTTGAFFRATLEEVEHYQQEGLYGYENGYVCKSCMGKGT